MSHRLIAPVAALLAASLVAACGTTASTSSSTTEISNAAGSMMSATAELYPTGAISNNLTTGKVTFTSLPHGVLVSGEVRGLAPHSEHGFHIHNTGDCADNGNASGGRFNPAGGTHGKFEMAGSHAGELPSLVADANGVARFSIDDHAISLTEGSTSNVVGRALVVHRDRDDYTTQPAGNSGPRIACALIARS